MRHPDDFTVVFDNFNRADDATHPPGGDFNAGTIYTGQAGLRITSQQLATTGTGYKDGYVNTTLAVPFAIGFMLAGTVSDQLFLHAVQATEAGGGYDGYELLFAGTQISLRRRAGSVNVAQQDGVLPAAAVATDEVRMIVDNDGSVYGWHKTTAGIWTQYVAMVQAVLVGPYHGGVESNSTSIRLDNMIFGNPDPPTGGPASHHVDISMFQ